MKTAVEYLWEIIGTIKTNPKDALLIAESFNQAKSMEKEHIENTFADGFVEGVETQKSGKQLLFPEQYYNQTFNQNK